MCLTTMACVYVQLCICVTIFSNGSIIRTSFQFTELHALTLATRFYALLTQFIATLNATGQMHPFLGFLPLSFLYCVLILQMTSSVIRTTTHHSLR